MFILFITNFFPPKSNGGTEKYTFSLIKSLQRKGHEVGVVYADEWQEGKDYWNGTTQSEYKSIPIWQAHINWTKAKDPNRALYYDTEAEKWMEELLKTLKPDIIHVTSSWSLGIGVLHSIRKSNIPFILTLMDFWFLCPRISLMKSNGELCEGPRTPNDCHKCLFHSSGVNRRFGNLLPNSINTIIWNRIVKLPYVSKFRGLRGYAINVEERKRMLFDSLMLPDLIISHSHTLKNIFESEWIPDRIIHLKNGHDLDWLNTYNGKGSSNQFSFGYIGQIIDIKGVHLLIEAFNAANFDSCVKLYICGDLNQDKNYVEKLYSLANNNKNIIFQGRFNYDQIGNIFSNIDVLVVPSLWFENAPLVIYEAFASGTPVIASDIGGMAEAIDHGETGLLFQRGNVDDLASQIIKIYSNPDIFEYLQNNIKPVKKIEEEVDELIKIYENVIRKAEKS
jgi:glycosyltransferase involved in cell wall biosynthesis